MPCLCQDPCQSTVMHGDLEIPASSSVYNCLSLVLQSHKQVICFSCFATCLAHACLSLLSYAVAATSVHPMCILCAAVDMYQCPAGKLRQLYATAMQMELDFFSSQPGTGPPPNVGMLVVDFDDTCTSTDTISQIFNTAIACIQTKAPGRCMIVIICCQNGRKT